MSLLQGAIRVISAAFMVVAAIALILMMVHVTADVAGKYLFNAPVPMTLEMVSNYYMVAAVFLPLAAVELADGHIHVELIHARLPRVGRRILDASAHFLALAFYFMVCIYGWDVAWKKMQVGEYIMGSYPVIIWPSRFLVPLGAALIGLLLILKFVRALRLIARPDLDPDVTDKEARTPGAAH